MRLGVEHPLFFIDTMPVRDGEREKTHKNRFIMHALHDIMRITTINIFISVGIPGKKVCGLKAVPCNQ